MTPKELTEAYVNALYEYEDAKEAQRINCDPYSNAELREARIRLDDLRTKADAMGVDLTDAHNAFVADNELPPTQENER